jgi:hypothetical protein
MVRIALRIALVCAALGAASSPSAARDFLERARAEHGNQDWAALEKTARARLAEAEDDPTALAFLAVAQAGGRDFAGCVETMKGLEAAGHSPAKPVGDFGVLLPAVVNAIYTHCWANFDPAFNRECWGPLFDAFPDDPVCATAASRLLMAALAQEDEAEVARYEEWFDRKVSEAVEKRFGDGPLLVHYSTAYLRAGVGGEKTLDLARRAFESAWESAARQHRYEGPGAEGGDDLGRREKCDLDCDREYSGLALACFLTGAFEPDRNPLAAREPEPGAVFEDATEEAGLAGLRHARVAVGDYDDDGDPDLCFQGVLYRNERGREFVDVTAEAGITKRGASALFGDYDNDGALDLLLPAVPHPHLYRNLGKKGRFRFEDVTEKAGLTKLRVEATPEGAAWFDADGDGWLDFYLAAYESPMSVGHPDLLARNEGDGTFVDASESSGIRAVPAMCGRGVAACDFDEDGDVDLYVSNYRLNANFLFVNDGAGKFEERSAALGVQGERQPPDGSYFGHTIGSCWGDVDGDGDLDLFTANLAHPRFVSQGFSNLSMLYRNPAHGDEQGEGAFRECRRESGIRFQETHSDPALVDYDNDGDLDLSITCVYEGVPSALFRNDGTGRFEPVTFRSRAVAFHGWGQAWLDHDGDGDLDLVVASSGGVRLLRNRGNDNHWLRVALEGKRGNRFGIGARVEVETLAGEPRRRFVREIRAGRGTTSQDESVAHFGLGDYAGRVRVSVTWPDTGHTESRDFPIDRRVTMRQVKITKKRP